MPVRVRVRNFQSIKDSEVTIDGLTVVTGPNNSGKTALMRAIRGLFTNAPAGPLIRYGEGYLSVELELGDGTTILWEKGWEKPDQKGGSVNRYFINGVKLDNVGRGVPPEVESLGVRPIQAASSQVWPQIAQQFDGTLFLINRPGSAVAEALSDVARVGKLTNALKLSEKDRRSFSGELKVRRKDVKSLEEEVEAFDGLDKVRTQVDALEALHAQALDAALALSQTAALRTALNNAKSKVDALEGFDPGVVPSSEQASLIQASEAQLHQTKTLRDRLNRFSETVETLRGFSVDIPQATRAVKMRELLKRCRALLQRLEQAQEETHRLSGVGIPEMPSEFEAEKAGRDLVEAQALIALLRDAQVNYEGLVLTAGEATTAYDAALVEVRDLLGDLGECPTCNTIHEPGDHA